MAWTLLCLAVLAGAVSAQIPPNLDPAKKVLTVNVFTGPPNFQAPVTGELQVPCNSVVELLAQVSPATPADTWYEWRDVTNNTVVNVLNHQMAVQPSGDTVYQFIVYDNATGNWGDAFVTVRSDGTPPMITLNGPFEMQITCGTPFVDPGASATDASGLPLSVVKTGAVNPHAVGSYTLTYSATNTCGQTATVTRTVRVVYPFGGFRPPIKADGSSVFKLGRTLPVKFRLVCGCNKNEDDDDDDDHPTHTGCVCFGSTPPVARIFIAKISNGIVGDQIAPETTDPEDPGNIFRYKGCGRYRFNLRTRGLSQGTWKIWVDLGDGADHTVIISLRS